MFTRIIFKIKNNGKINRALNVPIGYSAMNYFKKSNIVSENLYPVDPCKYCSGTGFVICCDCNGCGKVYFDGFKEFICDSCRGMGNCCCGICDGTGKCHNMF